MKGIKVEPVLKTIKSEPTKLETDTNSNYQNCPICLCNFKNNSVISNPDVCEHIFCLDCLQEWSKKINTCPIDRKIFSFILLKNNSNQIIQRIKVEDRTQSHREEHEQDLTFCEVCRQPNREDRMLLCDACDKGYHCECLNPQIDEIPEGEWFCPGCAVHRLNHSVPSTSNFERRIMARTNFSERVRRNVSANRRNLNETRVKKVRVVKRKKSSRRKRVKRVRKSVNLKTSKTTSKSLTIVKKYTKSRAYKGSIRGKKTRQILKKYTKTRKGSSKKRVKKRKFKKVKISAEERILKKIFDQDQKREKKCTTGDICANLASNFRTRSLNDEDHASIQLTSQTSEYFESTNTDESQNEKQEKLFSPSTDFLNSIMNSQSLLSKSSTSLKLNHDGSMKLINTSSKNLFKIKDKKFDDHGKSRSPQEGNVTSKCIKFKCHKTEIDADGKIKFEAKEHKYEPADKFISNAGLMSLNNLSNCKKEPIVPKLDQIVRQEVKFNPRTEIFDFNPNSGLKKTNLVIEKKEIKQEAKVFKEGQISAVNRHEESASCGLSRLKTEPIEARLEFLNKIKEENADSEPKERIKTELKVDSIQDQIALICKGTLKPYFVKNKITKEEYKIIMKKVVNKVRARVKNIESINTKKVIDLTLAYINRTEKSENKIFSS